jgi:hypothetical protein
VQLEHNHRHRHSQSNASSRYHVVHQNGRSHKGVMVVMFQSSFRDVVKLASKRVRPEHRKSTDRKPNNLYDPCHRKEMFCSDCSASALPFVGSSDSRETAGAVRQAFTLAAAKLSHEHQNRVAEVEVRTSI